MDTTERIRTLTGFPEGEGLNFRTALERIDMSLAAYARPGSNVEDLGVEFDQALGEYIETSEALADEIIPALSEDTTRGVDDATDRLDALLSMDVLIASLVSELCAEIEVPALSETPELSRDLGVELATHSIGREGFQFVLELVAGNQTIQTLRPPAEEALLISGGSVATVTGDVDEILDKTATDAIITLRRSTGVVGHLVSSYLQKLFDNPEKIRDELEDAANDVRDALGWLARGAARLWRAAAKKIGALLTRTGVGQDLATFAEEVASAASDSGAIGEAVDEASEDVAKEVRKRIRSSVGAALLGCDEIIKRCDSAILAGDTAKLLGQAKVVVESFGKRRRFVKWGNRGILAMSTAAYVAHPMMVPTAVAAAIVLAGNYWKAHDHLDAHEVGVLKSLPDRNEGLMRAVGA